MHVRSSQLPGWAASSLSAKSDRFGMRLPKIPLSPNSVYNSLLLNQDDLESLQVLLNVSNFEPNSLRALNIAETFARLWLGSQERDWPSRKTWTARAFQVCESWCLSLRGLLQVGSFKFLSAFAPGSQSSWLLRTRVSQPSDLPLFSGRLLWTLSSGLIEEDHLHPDQLLLSFWCIQKLLMLYATTGLSYFRHPPLFVDVCGGPFGHGLTWNQACLFE